MKHNYSLVVMLITFGFFTGKDVLSQENDDPAKKPHDCQTALLDEYINPLYKQIKQAKNDTDAIFAALKIKNRVSTFSQKCIGEGAGVTSNNTLLVIATDNSNYFKEQVNRLNTAISNRSIKNIEFIEQLGVKEGTEEAHEEIGYKLIDAGTAQ